MTVQRTIVRNAPATKPVGYGVSQKKSEETKEFNRSSKFVQGYRTQLPAIGAIPVVIKLESPGKWLLGVSIVPASGINADIADVVITLKVNGLNMLVDMAANNANPGYVQGILFLPTPQPLQGDDNITLTIEKKSGAGVPFIFTNIFYIPR